MRKKCEMGNFVLEWLRIMEVNKLMVDVRK